jgi:tRNA pseudouridine55 synthase
MKPSAGLLLLDKPPGPSSHDIVNRLRKLSGSRRIGHAGTLDPLASGLMLLCLGRATRLVEYLVGLPKTYETTVRLGQSTATYDAEGAVAWERPFTHLTLPTIAATLSQFRGTIWQQPPSYSAIKQGGQPLYKLARRGIAAETPARPVTIYTLDLLAWDAPFLRLRVGCSSGTYIRSLGHDLGEALGCGGHLAALRRTAVGPFTIAQAAPLDSLTPENLNDYTMVAETAVAHLPRLDLPTSDADRLLLGQRLARQTDHRTGAFVAATGAFVAAYDPDGQFIGVLLAESDYWQPHKMFPPQ